MGSLRLSPTIAWSVVILACLLRLTTLGYHSVWLDEAFDIWAASQHNADQIWNLRLDGNLPPLYYWLLHHVLAVLGTGEHAARLLSALASVAGVGLVYLLGRTLAPGYHQGQVAAVLLAVSPLDFWYAQEARMHGMVGPAALLFALGLFLDRWWAVPLTVAGLAFGLSVDHTMWPVALVVLGWWTVHRVVGVWTNGRRDIISCAWSVTRAVFGIVIALWIYSPWWYQAEDVYARLNTVPFFANVRQAAGIADLTSLSLRELLASTYVVCLAAAAVATVLARNARTSRQARRLAVLAFAALTALSVVPRAYGLKQVLVGFWPFATFVAAWSLTSLPTPTARPGASDPTGGGRGAAVLVALSSVALLVTFLTPKADWRGVARHLEASRDPVRPVVVLDPGYNQLPFGYYLPSYPVIAGPVVSLEPLAAAARDRRDVCLVAERFGKPTPTSPTEAWFDAHLRLTRSRPFARLELRCYRVP